MPGRAAPKSPPGLSSLRPLDYCSFDSNLTKRINTDSREKTETTFPNTPSLVPSIHQQINDLRRPNRGVESTAGLYARCSEGVVNVYDNTIHRRVCPVLRRTLAKQQKCAVTIWAESVPTSPLDAPSSRRCNPPQ